MEAARQITYEGKIKHANKFFSISNKSVVEEGKVADFEGEEAAYRKLRDARSEARYVGKREKRAKAKVDEAESSKK